MKTLPRIGGRQRLIDAALVSLGERGYHRSSLRVIAATAGVTAGLVKHHFQGKDELMLEAFRHFRDGLSAVYRAEADKAGTDPVKRLEAFTRSIFRYNAAHAENRRIWASFVELVTTNAEVAAVQVASCESHLQEIRDCVAGIYAARGEKLSPDAADRLALGINSIIDGAWLECGLNPSRMTLEEAMEIALDMIGERLGVSFSTGAESDA